MVLELVLVKVLVKAVDKRNKIFRNNHFKNKYYLFLPLELELAKVLEMVLVKALVHQ